MPAELRPAVYPAPISSARFASLIRRDSPENCRVALLGMPDDTGVRLNGGRPGASEGPSAFRAALAALGSAEPAGWVWPGVFDAGDVIPAEDIHETHSRVTRAAGALLHMGLLPVGIGGGHDLTYPFVRAAADNAGVTSGLYLDAHLDVRDSVGSGMPFRRLIEDCQLRDLRAVGIDPFVNSAEHTLYFVERGGEAIPLGDPRCEDPQIPAGDIFVSLDLDVLGMSHAPGVSAMNPLGLWPSAVARWCEHAGRSENVRCFDIMELCPPHDEGGRTARLAARMFLHFLRGFAERSG